MTGFPVQVAGWLFVAAAAMLWLGWVLLPAQPSAFFQPGDFPAIRRQYRRWIWLFRIHIFGFLVTVMAAAALAALIEGADVRVLAWPGLTVLATGAVVGALGAAYYYHMGAWGAVDLDGRGEDETLRFIAGLRVSTHYATCLVRFSRVVFGLGQVVLAAARCGGLLPAWLAWAGAALGLAAIAVIMARPDAPALYRPIFHLNAAWILAVGLVVLNSGAGGPR